MTTSLPNLFDSPDNLVRGVKLIKFKAQYGKLKRLLSKTKDASKKGEFNERVAVTQGIDPNALKAMEYIQQRLKSDDYQTMDDFVTSPKTKGDLKALQLTGLTGLLQ